MAKLAASKTATDDTPVAPKDISGDVSSANVIDDSHSTRPKRKRAGDFNDFEEDEAVVGGVPKEPKPTAAQPKKKSKTASATEKKAKPSEDGGKKAPAAEKKGKEGKKPSAGEKKTKSTKDDGKSTAAPEGKLKPSKTDDKAAPKPKVDKSNKTNKTQPSKEDGHPIVTEKTHPGGDMVETEPIPKPKAQEAGDRKSGRKGKATEKASKPAQKEADSSTAQVQSAKKKKTLPEQKDKPPAQPKSKAKNDEKGKAATNPALKADSGKTDVAAITAENNKRNTEGDAEGPTSHAQHIKRVSEPKKPQEKKTDAESKAQSKKSGKDAAAKTKGESSSKKAKAPKPSKPAESSSAKKGEESKPAPAESSDAVLEPAMDETPFKKLLKREKGKIPAIKASADKAEAERKADAATSKDKPAGKGTKASDKPAAKAAPSKAFEKAAAATPAKPSAKAEAPKGKKRKEGSDPADAKTEAGPSEKKQKKSRKSALEVASEAVGDLVNSGIEVAAQGVNAVKDIASGLGNNSIADDITAVAQGVAEEKTKKGSNKKTGKDALRAGGKSAKGKGKEKAVEDDAADDFSGLEDSEDEDDYEEGDQTLALIKGFESEGDERHPADDEGFKEGMEVPKLPSSSDLTKKLEAAKEGSDDGPGVIYVGRIPHGFYEPQMRAYFSQFGPLLRLRLSRNRSTGASKHYAFLEFASARTAAVAADTMHNYLLFGHILKCRVVPREEVHEQLWKGAGRRFKKVPWARIEGRKMEMKVGRGVWEERVKREEKRRGKKGEKLKEIGYEFEGNGLKAPPQQEIEGKAIEGAGEGIVGTDMTVQEEKTIVTTDGKDGTVTISEEVKTTKTKTKATKKAGKRKADDEKEADGDKGKAGEQLAEVAKKVKKAKKSTDAPAAAAAAS